MSRCAPLFATGLIAFFVISAAFAQSAAALPAESAALDAAAFFDGNCAPCHTIGGGEQGGPDLKWVTQRRDRQWLIRFVLDPDAMVAAGDPRIADMIKHWDGAVMPKVPELSPQLAEAILEFIDKKSDAAGAAAPGAVPVPTFTVEDVVRGRALFTGTTAAAQGTPPCITCHAARDEGGALGGGRLGLDLTLVSARLRGPRGIGKWLEAPPTPMMRALVRRAPLTADENRALTAFFEDVRTRQPSPPARQMTRFGGMGAGGGIVAMLLIAGIWRNRFRAVRRPLVARAGGSLGRGGHS